MSVHEAFAKTTGERAADRISGRRVAIVSGASSGIGRAVAVHLSGAGYDIVAGARRAERLEALAEEIRQEGGRCDPVPVDVTEVGTADHLFDVGTFDERRPAAFVLSAGIGLPGTLLSSDPSRWRNLIEVNLLSVMHQLRASALRFREAAHSDTGRNEGLSAPFVRDIVVIGSTVGREVSAANPVYGATKFAVHSLVESLRREVCSDEIRVTLVEPGFVGSEFQETAGYDSAWMAAVGRECGPFLAADDVGRLVAFVISQPPGVHVDDVRVRPTRQRA